MDLMRKIVYISRNLTLTLCLTEPKIIMNQYKVSGNDFTEYETKVNPHIKMKLVRKDPVFIINASNLHRVSGFFGSVVGWLNLEDLYQYDSGDPIINSSKYPNLYKEVKNVTQYNQTVMRAVPAIIEIDSVKTTGITLYFNNLETFVQIDYEEAQSIFNILLNISFVEEMNLCLHSLIYTKLFGKEITSKTSRVEPSPFSSK
jgi:hypothetical protein